MISEHYILTSSNLLKTIEYELKDYFNILNKTGIQVNNDNYLKYSNKYIFEHENFYIQNKQYFDRNINYNSQCFISVNDSTNTYGDLTLHEYLLLIRNIMIIYDKSFNFDYTKTCPPNNSTTKLYNISDNSVLNIENLYCKYIKFSNNIYPLFIGSYVLEKTNMDTVYIYNICSNTNETNLFLKTTYITNVLMKQMLKMFYIVTKCKTFALFVELNNPSFSKAFSLYYNLGFKPLIDTVETNESYIDKMLGCDASLSEYIKCKNLAFTKMLMMTSEDTTKDFIFKYSTKFTSKNQTLDRGIQFYDSILAFSYRCSCILDKFLLKNKNLCESNINLLNYYFEKDSGKNQQIIHKDNNGFKNYFYNIDIYISQSNDPFSVISTFQKQIVNNNISLYRFIGYLVNNIIPLDDVFNKNVRYVDPKFEFKLTEDINGNLSYKLYSIETIDSLIKNINITNNNKNSFKDIETVLINEISKYNLNTNINQNDKLIFFPCGYYFISEKNSNKNVLHAVSFVYNKIDEELYFYDPQNIDDRRSKEDLFTFKCLTSIIKTILKKNNCKVNATIDLTKYVDPKSKDKYGNFKYLYAKIQNNFADDDYGTLCTILSHIPYVALNLIDTNKPIFKQLQTYIWFLFFSSIILKQKQKINTPTVNLQSNIMTIFPYIYLNLYKLIKIYNQDNQNKTQDDDDIFMKLQSNTNELTKNIFDLNNHLITVFNDPSEIPTKYIN